MTSTGVPDGASVFVDANVFIYNFSGPTTLRAGSRPQPSAA